MIASREVVKILESESPGSEPLSIIIGENERRLFKYLEDNQRVTVKEFAKHVNISERRAGRILVNLVRAWRDQNSYGRKIRVLHIGFLNKS